MPLLAVVVGAAGCLGGGDDELKVDLATCGDAVVYRIDRVEIPRNNVGAREMALDLDRDGLVDNQLGQVAGTLHGFFLPPFELAEAANRRLETDVAWHLAVRRCAGDHVAIAVGRQLGETHVVGTSGGGAIDARGKTGEVPLSTLFDPLGTYADPGWQRSGITALQLAEPTGDRLEGILVVAPRAGEAFGALTRPMTAFIQSRAATEPSLGEYFDTNFDGEISLAEVEESSLTRSLLYPDVALDDSDTPTGLSYGIRIRATRVR